MRTQLKMTRGRGFHLNFTNGLTLSVQIGAGNYCDNYNEPFDGEGPLPSSTCAEIAVWPQSGDFVNIKGDSVGGYVPVQDLFLLMTVLSSLPQDATESQIEDAITGVL